MNYIQQFDPNVREVLKALRTIIRKTLPELSEYVEKDMLAYSIGPNTYKASVCVISGHKAHATLAFLWGTKLVDPGKLLQGNGKTGRHLKLTSVHDVPKMAVSRWVKQAAKLASDQ